MKNYIVLAKNNSGVIVFINCDYYSIIEYVENLKFGERLNLYFISLKKIEEEEEVYLDLIPAENVLFMDNDKSLNDFKEEVSDMLEKLDIKKTVIEEDSK